MKIKTPDARYTIGREWCGQVNPMWIVRFCTHWVAKADTLQEAEEIAEKHNKRLDPA